MDDFFDAGAYSVILVAVKGSPLHGRAGKEEIMLPNVGNFGRYSAAPRPTYRLFGLARPAGIILVLAGVLGAGMAQAQGLRTLLEGPLEPLKVAYNECNEEALRQLLGPGEAAVCSMIYEAVKRRVFDGDFARLIAWSKAAAAERQVAKASPPAVEPIKEPLP